MKANKIKPGMKSLDLELKVVDKEEPHTFENDNGEGRVATAICEDDSGEVKVSLWNEEIDKVSVGDEIKIENGYSRLFKNEVYVSAGKYGELKTPE